MYPSSVRQMLTNRSAPQPLIMKTPTGGTGMLVLSTCLRRSFGIRPHLQRMVMTTMRMAGRASDMVTGLVFDGCLLQAEELSTTVSFEDCVGLLVILWFWRMNVGLLMDE